MITKERITIPRSMVISHPGETALKKTPNTVPRSSTGSMTMQML
jgi:hypothetical protein